MIFAMDVCRSSRYLQNALTNWDQIWHRDMQGHILLYYEILRKYVDAFKSYGDLNFTCGEHGAYFNVSVMVVKITQFKDEQMRILPSQGLYDSVDTTRLILLLA